MAGTYYPVYSGAALIVYVALQDAAIPNRLKASPTIAAGDFKYSLDGVAVGNVDAQSVAPAASVWVKLTINSVSTADWIQIQCIDQTATPEWADLAFAIPTHVANINANVAAMAAGVITATVVADATIDAATFAAGAINAAAIADAAIDAATFAAGAIDANAIAADAIGSSEVAATAVTKIQAGLATSAALATVQADTDDIQTRLPAALVGGRMDSSVGAVAANAITAASIATDAIDSDAIAASAVTEIQAGLATAASLATVQADTDDIQTRLPAALVGGRMDSSVGSNLDKTGYTLSAAGIQAVWDALTANLVTAGSIGKVLADNIKAVSGTALYRALGVMYGALAGKLTGNGTGTVTIRDVADSQNVVVATIDVNKDRTATTVTPPP